MKVLLIIFIACFVFIPISIFAKITRFGLGMASSLSDLGFAVFFCKLIEQGRGVRV